MRNLLSSALAVAFLAVPAVAASQSSTAGGSNINLRAIVPVICKLKYQADIAELGEGFRLGQIKQYCNAPNGFTVSVDYSPGTLKNTLLRLGGQSVKLNGSGHEKLYSVNGPQVRQFEVSAIPGASGFDADQIQFLIDPN